MREWSLIFSTEAQSENKGIPAQFQTPACGFWVWWLLEVFSFFFSFYAPLQLLRFAAASSCKGKTGVCPDAAASCQTQPPASCSHKGHGRDLSHAREGHRSQRNANCRRKAQGREAPPNPANAEPWLGRTSRCRGWRCLQSRKSSSGTRQHFEPAEKLSVFVLGHVSWMCHTRGKSNPRLK